MTTDEEYLAQGSARLEKYLSAINGFIDMFPEPRRTQVRRMMDGPQGSQFMTAPASTRRRFHYAFPCGLVAHSLNVAMNAVKLADLLAPGRWPAHRIIFCALFHDIGKSGTPGKPYYTETKEHWKREKGEFYDVSMEEFMPNAEKSLHVLQLHGVTLDWEEAVAIRLNDGMGSESNREYSFREPALALIIHWADHWAMRMEKEENE